MYDNSYSVFFSTHQPALRLVHTNTRKARLKHPRLDRKDRDMLELRAMTTAKTETQTDVAPMIPHRQGIREADLTRITFMLSDKSIEDGVTVCCEAEDACEKDSDHQSR